MRTTASPAPFLTCLALVAVLAACGQAEAPGPVMHPGDSAFRLLDDLRLEVYPESNLPLAVAQRVAARTPFRTAVLAASAWQKVGPAPTHKIAWPDGPPAPGLRVWRVDVAVRAEYTVMRDGRPVPVWEGAAGEPFPGQAFHWSARRGLLTAVAQEPPEGVYLAYEASPEATLVSERPALDDVARAEQLLTRARAGGVSRRGLLLPAPGVIALPLGRLAGETLHVGARLRDECWVARPAGLQRGEGLSDGVTFSVEIAWDDEQRRIWSRHVSVDDGFVEAAIDVSAWSGRAVTLRFRTEPGPAGDASFDYALWTGLRLSGPVRRPPARPHVILVDVDTLRADRLGCYGFSDRPTSPRIDAWAQRRATVYRDATSTATWTLPATASMLTGLAVHQHGVDDFTGEALGSQASPLARRLWEAGYETRAWTDGGFVSEPFGFDLGFTRFEAVHRDETDWSVALRWLAERRSERPFFLYLHTYMVHMPYRFDPRFEDARDPYDGWLAGRDVGFEELTKLYREAPERFDEADRAYVGRMYDAGIARMDAYVGSVLERLEELLADQPYLLVLTSDHGEAFFEHGSVAHSGGLYDELLRIPLLVRFPEPRVGTDVQPVSLLDIVPTVLDVAGLPADGRLPGRSLVRAHLPERPRVSSFSTRAEALHQAGYKYIAGRTHADEPERQLFRLDDDPGELVNLADVETDTVARMHAELQRYLAEWPVIEPDATTDDALDAATLDELRALGYLGDG